ncbi:MAG: type II secretion system inner membrane protein GspF [Maricaulaceae bacterium]
METFDYTAIDQSKARQKGTVSAGSAREARASLRDRGLKPITLRPAKQSRANQSGSSSDDGSQKRSKKVSHKDLTQATRQLSILIGAASPVEDALHVVAQQFDKSDMRQKLLSVRGQVMEGARLSRAMKNAGGTFPDLYTAMVASAETSGQLAPVLDRLAEDLEAAQAIRRKIMAAIVYPIVLSIVALIVVVIMLISVVPKVVSQFQNFGQELPWLTRAVIASSDFLKAYGILIFVICATIFIGFRFALRQESFKRKWHSALLKGPFIGGLIRMLNAARFSRTMSSLIASGTPALTAMEAAQYTLQSLPMRDAVVKAGDKVRGGMAMSKALRQEKVFPPLVVQMLAGGEASGDVGQMFGKSADYLEDEFESIISIFLALLEPLIIIFLAVIVLLIIGAIFLPILKLNSFIV